jgi:hypothetical protein
MDRSRAYNGQCLGIAALQSVMRALDARIYPLRRLDSVRAP